MQAETNNCVHFYVLILSNNPRDEVSGIIWQYSRQYSFEENIVDYNPPINFRVILLATLRHVV